MQATGAVLYTLSCAVGPCVAGVADTRLALMVGSLLQPPLSLEGLSAFDMHTGEVLWQGVPDARLVPVTNGSCTAPAFPRQDIHFSCTCMPTAVPAADGADAAQIGAQGGPVSVGRDGGRIKGQGLCAFSVAVETGKLRYEVRALHVAGCMCCMIR